MFRFTLASPQIPGMWPHAAQQGLVGTARRLGVGAHLSAKSTRITYPTASAQTKPWCADTEI